MTLLKRFRVLLPVATLLAMAPVPTSAADDNSLGELLYTTHCIACHTTEIHWRDRKLATDWATLTGEVRRWQGNMGLGWTDGDIAAVVRYLNARYYRFPGAPGSVAVAAPRGAR